MRPILLLLALLLPLSAQETLLRVTTDPVTDTHVEIIALFTKPSPGGFMPVRVNVANNLAQPGKVQISFETGSQRSGDTSSSSEIEFEVPAGKAVTRDVMVSLGQIGSNYGGGTNLTTRLNGSFGKGEYTISADLDPQQPAILLSEKLFTPNASKLDSAITSKFTGTYRTSSEFGGKFDPKQLPDDWLAFSGYDSLLMTDTDWSNVPPGSRNAILSWVRLGGQLVIYCTTPTTLAALALPEDASYGSITLNRIPASLELKPDEAVELVTSTEAGPRQTALRGKFDGMWPLQNKFGEKGFHYTLFIIVLVIFGILVAPLNLFVFAKAGKRHRLFITTPIISLGASLILILMILFQDGFGGAGMRQVLMEVRPDAGQNAAFIHQEQISRTGVLASGRFTLAQSCAINPVVMKESRWARYTSSNMGGSYQLQPAGHQLLASGDWFQSRSEQGHALTAVRSTRGRVERTPEQDVLTSTFDFPIETLFYLDASFKWHRADHIVTGQKFKLTPVEFSSVHPWLNKEALAFTARNRQFLKQAAERPGCFIAVTQKAPGIDTAPFIKWNDTHTVITGPVATP